MVIHPRSLTANLPLKNGGKGRRSFPIGNSQLFRGELLKRVGGGGVNPMGSQSIKRITLNK